MATITPLNSSSIYDEKVIRELFEQHYTPLVLFAKGYIPDLDTDKDVVRQCTYDEGMTNLYGNSDNYFQMNKICVSLHHVKN